MSAEAPNQGMPNAKLSYGTFRNGIPYLQATLKVYKGGHTAAFLDKRFVDDVREFTSRGQP